MIINEILLCEPSGLTHSPNTLWHQHSTLSRSRLLKSSFRHFYLPKCVIVIIYNILTSGKCANSVLGTPHYVLLFCIICYWITVNYLSETSQNCITKSRMEDYLQLFLQLFKWVYFLSFLKERTDRKDKDIFLNKHAISRGLQTCFFKKIKQTTMSLHVKENVVISYFNSFPGCKMKHFWQAKWPLNWCLQGQTRKNQKSIRVHSSFTPEDNFPSAVCHL